MGRLTLANIHSGATTLPQTKECIPLTTLEDMHLWAYGFLGFATDFFEMFPNTSTYIMPARFSQDSLENLFGCIRGVGHQSNNPNVLAAAQSMNVVVERGNVRAPARGSYKQRDTAQA